MGSNILCATDYLEILEQNESNEFASLKKYCGEDEPATFVSSKSQIQVHHVQTVNLSGVGWRIRFMGVREGLWWEVKRSVIKLISFLNFQVQF